MPRALRIEYSGAIYHVMNRGNGTSDVFLGDEDRHLFLETLGEACGKTDWQVHAYCLMRNHFHLVVETPSPTLVAGMKWMLGTYTQRFNARHRVRGHLFAGRYKALNVDESNDAYLRTVCDYVHLNPLRAGLVPEASRLETFTWSSYPSYLATSGKRIPWLRVDRLLGEHGIQSDDARGRREFSRRMEDRRLDPVHTDADSKIRRGWWLGGEDFLDRLRDRMTPAVRDRQEPEAVRQSMTGRATQILHERLLLAGVDEKELSDLPKGLPLKIEIARELRRATTLTLKDVAALLHAGNWRTLANALSKPNVSI